MKIQKLSMLPGSSDGDDSIARKAISASEQMRAATGIDLPEMARRLSEGRSCLCSRPTRRAAPPRHKGVPKKAT